MNLEAPQRRHMGDPLAPMINVVFLLLIFFMLVARMAPPDPFETEPPEAAGGAPVGRIELFLSPEGEFAFGEARGAAALAHLAELRGEESVLLRADAGMEGVLLARALKTLAEAGIDPIELVSLPRREAAQ